MGHSYLTVIAWGYKVLFHEFVKSLGSWSDEAYDECREVTGHDYTNREIDEHRAVDWVKANGLELIKPSEGYSMDNTCLICVTPVVHEDARAGGIYTTQPSSFTLDEEDFKKLVAFTSHPETGIPENTFPSLYVFSYEDD